MLFLMSESPTYHPANNTQTQGNFEVIKMNYVDTGIIAIGDLIAGLAMALWVVLLVSPAVAMTVAIVGKKWNNLNRKRIGAELEMLNRLRHDNGGTHHSLANWLSINGITSRVAEYNSPSTREFTKVQPDSSVAGNGFEIVSPVMYDDESKSWFKSVFKALRGLTNSSVSAGYHVHIGLKDLHTYWGSEYDQISWDDARSIAGRVAYAFGYFEQGAWDMLVSPSRRNGEGMSVSMYSLRRAYSDNLNIGQATRDEYCHDAERYITVTLDVDKDNWFRSIYERFSGDRYQKLNLRSLQKHGTIEFRQHQCINADGIKAERWANLCFDFVNRCVGTDNCDNLTDYPRTLEGMFDWLGFAESDSQRLYWLARSKLLAGQSVKPCSSCGSSRCMLDNNCPTDSDRANEMQNNYQAYQDSNPAEPSTYSDAHCDGCDEVVTYHNLYVESLNYNRDNECWEIVSEYDCDECGSNEYSVARYGMSTLALGLALAFPVLTAIALLVGCGIGAIHGAGKAFNVKAKSKTLWTKLVSRGGEASGFAFEAGDGVKYLKAAESSVAMAHNMNTYLDKSVLWTAMHTRYATHGGNTDENAHPHFDSTGQLMLVHNGVVDNYLSAWPKLNQPQTGDVDSMVVAQALYEGGIEKVVEICEGSMSLIWSDARDTTGTLKCWTNGGNPLHMGRLDDKETGAVVIASTVNHLKDSFGKRLKSDWAAYIGREYTIHPDGSITKRDIDGSADTYNAKFSRHWSSYYDWKPKATGTADNCRISTTTGVGETDHVHKFKDTVLDEWGGWPAFDITVKGALYQYHGYDILANEGIRPDSTRYELPQYYDSNYWEDCDDLLLGRLDPRYTDMEYDDHWLDNKYAEYWEI
jgi:hypothetical protein